MNNILVIGERLKDVFIYSNISRLDPAGPWPVLNPIRIETNPGGAANVVENLKSLSNGDINIHFFHQELEITKTRYICDKTNHCFLRVDENDRIKDDDQIKSYDQFLPFLQKSQIALKDFDCVIISEYGKNFLSVNFINHLASLCSMFNIPIFLDTKFHLGRWSEDIDFVKINKKEFLASNETNHFCNKFCKNIIVTTGENGATLNQNEDFPLEKRVEVMNLCGAGDTFLAALVINYLETKDIRNAIKWANKACSYKVTQKGVIAVPRNKVN